MRITAEVSHERTEALPSVIVLVFIRDFLISWALLTNYSLSSGCVAYTASQIRGRSDDGYFLYG